MPLRHRIVALDAWIKVPPLNFDAEVVQYPNSTPEEIPTRIRDATIVVVSGTPLGREAIESALQLQLVACNGVGTNHIDHAALRERGVTLCYVPGQNTHSVSEHAFALYLSLSRHIIPMHNLVLDGSTWVDEVTVHRRFPTMPRTANEETLVVVGYGALGRSVERIGRALGMRTLVAERKGASHLREGRIAFSESLTQGTLFILTAPYDASTRDMFSGPEFAVMSTTALLVNVGRGGVVNEHALAQALRNGEIGGAGIDVFEHEPATLSTSPLLDASLPNLVLSPHIAWFAARTVKGTIATVKANLEAFAAGRAQNVLIAGTYAPST